MVNEVANELWKITPDLRLIFGLHATSVKKNMSEIAMVDPRVEILCVNNHFNSMKKHLGVNAKEVLAQLNDEILPQTTKGFLRQKINKKYYLPVWTFDKE